LNQLQDSIHILFNLIIRESHHSKALIPEMNIPFLIVENLIRLQVNGSVDLDDQSFFKTEKISDVAINRLLSPEFESRKRTISQFSPKQVLMTRRLFSKISGSGN